MSKLDLFICDECGELKFSHPSGIFSVDDLFYCFRCCNYTENIIDVINDTAPHPPEPPLAGGLRGGHPLSER